jgi:DNA-binding CsgD family transcriptional regulator
MVAMTNRKELVRDLVTQGKTEDEIAGILDIDVRQVHVFLEGQKR